MARKFMLNLQLERDRKKTTRQDLHMYKRQFRNISIFILHEYDFKIYWLRQKSLLVRSSLFEFHPRVITFDKSNAFDKVKHRGTLFFHYYCGVISDELHCLVSPDCTFTARCLQRGVHRGKPLPFHSCFYDKNKFREERFFHKIFQGWGGNASKRTLP